ncbi:hypothetical protein ABZ738_27480 [Micromonospora sp. NPDC047793]|uniref:hypothetical protein n=1 Tax=Micromonospora sp. NPDC047793 TaxID=3154342 RepID=UPI0033EE96BD
MAVYSEGAEHECFATLCRLVAAMGCVPNGAVEVAPWDAEFELRSDLAGRSAILDVKPDRFARIVAGEDEGGRAVRAGYRRKRGTLVIVEYLAASGGDRHPIAVSASADGLGIPIDLWRKSERASAARLADWATNLLRKATAECGVWYGAIGVEYSLATPSELAAGAAVLTSEVFASRKLVDHNDDLRKALLDGFRGGVISEWPNGWFCSGWAPFNAGNGMLSVDKAATKRAGVALGRAVLNR